MKHLWKKIILILLCLATIGVATWNVVATLDAYAMKSKIYETAKEQGILDEPEIAEALETWKSVVLDRAIGGGLSVVFMGLILAYVLYVGPAPKKKERISQKEAQALSLQFEEEYQQRGQTTGEKEEEEEEDAKEITASEEKLAKPKLTSAIYHRKAVILTWRTVDGAQGYTIYRRHDKEAWTKIATIKENSEMPSYVDYALASDRNYDYSVKAYIERDGHRVYSKMNSMGLSVYIKKGNVLPAPAMHVIELPDGRKALTWDEVEGALSYHIYRISEATKWKRCAIVKANEERIYTEEAQGAYRYAVASTKRIQHVVIAGEHDANGVSLS